MIAEYKKEVLNYYEQKKAAGDLSLNLRYPTRAKLRDECIEVINSRYLKKDKNTIEASLGDLSDMTAFVMRVKRKGAEKLKTFDNFLKDHEIDTDIKNIELLAWLIDFEPRPYKFGQVYSTSFTEEPVNIEPEISRESFLEKSRGEGEPETGNEGPSPLPVQVIKQKKGNTGTAKKPFPVRLVAITLITIALLTLGTYHILIRIRPTIYPLVTGTEKCMVWAGDHYQPVPCALKFDGQQVIALDSVQVKGFKKIMRPDTVTRNSVDKLWYFKTGSSLELFTAPGFHPVHTDRKLKRLTEHMLFTYVHHN